MQPLKICPLLAPTINRLVDMQRSLLISQMLGDYKLYKIMRQQYTDYGVKHFGLLKHINFPKIQIPVFSREGLNVLKIAVRDMFRKKTPNEKELARLFKQEKLRRKYKIDTMG